MAEPKCPECNGHTIEYRRQGADTQYRLCSRYAEPGHLPEWEIRQKLRELRQAIKPSGRFA